MTVIALTIDSFKRVRAARLHPSPMGLVPVRGRNAAGKSSLIEAMLAALGGKAAAVELPITEGAHGAEVVLDMGEIVVRRRWKRDSAGKATTSLTVEAADGSKVTSPQAVLDNLVGRFADPVAFLNLKPADQVRTVLGVMGLDGALSRLEAQAADAFDRRRDLGREADRAGKAADVLAAEVSSLPASPGGSSLSELTQALQDAQAANERRRRLQARKEAIARSGTAAVDRIDALRAELAEAVAAQAIEREEWVRVWADLKSAAEVDEAPIVAALNAHEAAAKHAARRELLASQVAHSRQAQEAHAEAGAELDGLRDKIAAVLAAAPFPLPEMAYDAEEKQLLLNGIPFGVASQAERIKAAAAVAMAGNPQIRVLFAREGSLLDDESRMQLATLAAEKGWQLFLEVVDSNPAGAGIWIQDGEASE